MPKGKPLSARDGPIFETHASATNANELKANLTEGMKPLSNCRDEAGVFYWTAVTMNRFAMKKNILAKKSPRETVPRGFLP
jgi:hypothetical protein